MNTLFYKIGKLMTEVCTSNAKTTSKIWRESFTGKVTGKFQVGI